MHYHAQSKQFTVGLDGLEGCAQRMRFAIRKIRLMAGRPLEGGTEFHGAMTDACHAEQAILDGCLAIGIDLGAERSGMLDLREV